VNIWFNGAAVAKKKPRLSRA